MRRIIVSKSGNTLAGNTGAGFKAPSRAALTVATTEAFREDSHENRTYRGVRSSIAIMENRAVYGQPIDQGKRARAEARQAKARAANLAKVQAQAPITNAEALELIRKHREFEARLIAEEKASAMAEAKAKRIEFVRQRQSALAALSKC
jgi:hypothetical protein